VGQNSISHPSVSTALESAMPKLSSPNGSGIRSNIDPSDHDFEDANLPGSLPTLRTRNIKFSKEQDEDLPARIERIWYINPYGQEMSPLANPRAIEAIRDGQAIIYSIGSLYTSIAPSVVLRGVGEAVRTSAARHKILILNGSLDREVGPSSHPFTALDFVYAITRAGEQSRGLTWRPQPQHQLKTSRSEMDIPSSASSSPTNIHRASPLSVFPFYDTSTPRKYVTHVIHLAGEGTPAVDRAALAAIGIDCLKLYGRKIEVAGPDGRNIVKGMRYDNQALIGAIQAILGKKGDAMTANGRSRRFTLDG
jgi:2-phospho-L-lactate transferase CofD